ncbi:hypothetical protein C8J56DRAFT_1035505 [Mycena floridula]|nr:hypothetical protein C8J56DRAFT_1035505 [Mycena floridula]
MPKRRRDIDSKRLLGEDAAGEVWRDQRAGRGWEESIDGVACVEFVARPTLKGRNEDIWLWKDGDEALIGDSHEKSPLPWKDAAAALQKRLTLQPVTSAPEMRVAMILWLVRTSKAYKTARAECGRADEEEWDIQSFMTSWTVPIGTKVIPLPARDVYPNPIHTSPAGRYMWDKQKEVREFAQWLSKQMTIYDDIDDYAAARELLGEDVKVVGIQKHFLASARQSQCFATPIPGLRAVPSLSQASKVKVGGDFGARYHCFGKHVELDFASTIEGARPLAVIQHYLAWKPKITLQWLAALPKDTINLAQVYEIIQMDVLTIFAHMLTATKDRRVFLSQTPQDAQVSPLNILSQILDLPDLTYNIMSRFKHALADRSRKSGPFPECLTLRGLDMTGGWSPIKCPKMARSELKGFLKSQLSHTNVLRLYGIYLLEHTDGSPVCMVSPWMDHGNMVHFLETSETANRKPQTAHRCATHEWIHVGLSSTWVWSFSIHSSQFCAVLFVSSNDHCSLPQFHYPYRRSQVTAIGVAPSAGTSELTALFVYIWLDHHPWLYTASLINFDMSTNPSNHLFPTSQSPAPRILSAPHMFSSALYILPIFERSVVD